jgi:hypothetical protein
MVEMYREADEILNEEGDLDGESDFSDIEMKQLVRERRDSGSQRSG